MPVLADERCHEDDFSTGQVKKWLFFELRLFIDWLKIKIFFDFIVLVLGYLDCKVLKIRVTHEVLELKAKS